MKNVEKIKLKDVDIKHINVNTIFGLYLEYKEVINYLIFGAFTMAVNFASYFIFAKLFHIDEVVSSGLSWFCAVLFAYITNRKIVFKSKSKKILKEFTAFVSARIFTLILEMLIMFIFVTLLKLDSDLWVVVWSLVAQIVVIVVNYVLSKLVIFKKEKNDEEN